MPIPFFFDAHLDLSMNALEWNRDLRWSIAEIRASEKAQVGILLPKHGHKHKDNWLGTKQWKQMDSFAKLPISKN